MNHSEEIDIMEEILNDRSEFAGDITMLGTMLYQLKYVKTPAS